jgi:O-antigen biosynthesis protein
VTTIGGSVHDVLKLGGPGATGWNSFDPEWYLATYPDVREALGKTEPAAIRQFYLERGQDLGHSPNMYFDEEWHRHRYSRVTDVLLKGSMASAFDAYCRQGFHGRSPHWLFDEIYYRTCYPDVTDDYLASEGLANGYDHYLRYGQFSGGSGHWLFDPEMYQSELDGDERKIAERQGYFTHYLKSLRLKANERRTTILFDPSWYTDLMKRAGMPLYMAKWFCALHHYLSNATPSDFDPIPEFSEKYYLSRYRYVANAVRSGKYWNGYEHFLTEGRQKLLAPHRSIDLAYYASRENVARALEDGRARDAFEHYLRYGRILGLPTVPSEAQSIDEDAAQLLFRRKANNLLPLFGRRRLDFSCGDRPVLSVLLVLHNQFSLTMLALASLRDSFSGEIELILVDSGSTDETRAIGQYIAGANLLAFPENLGFVRACNAGLMLATADFVLLMNNDVELAPGAVEIALQRLKSHPRVGAVGGKIVRCQGLLQEAGCIIWRDGTTSGYLRDGAPITPEANFVRQVDYCSAAFLMVRAHLMEELGGLDEAFAPAYYEDTDLCVRIRQAGHDVLYDPSVVIFHLEYGSAEGKDSVDVQVARGRTVFAEKHGTYLQGQPIRGARSQALARFANARSARRILFIEDTIPLRTIGSGFVRSSDLIEVMASLGYQVTVFPLSLSRSNLADIYSNMPETVEVMHDREIDSLADFLVEREGYFNILWIARTHNLDRIRHALDPVLGSIAPPAIILDSEAIASLRDAGRQALSHPEPADLVAALRKEFVHANICQSIVAVSKREADIIRSLGWSNVAIIGHMRTLSPTPRPFAEREGMLFVGAIHQQSSPNLDSLEWFIDQVLPIIDNALGWRTRLTIAGYIAPGVSLDQFVGHPRVTLRGAIRNLAPLYDAHRIFIAPTRFAAGQPYKIYEAASFGLPVVATELLRSQLGWQSGHDILSADIEDPELMAKLIIMVYQDEALWQSIRLNALDRLKRENDYVSYAGSVQRALGPPASHTSSALTC